MLVLAFDTAHAACQVAVVEDGLILACLVQPMASGQAEHLIPMIEHALSTAPRRYEELDRLVVSVGPGTFAGVRIALSCARALGLVLNIPVIGISTLHVVAVAAREAGQATSMMAALDARRGDIYGQVFAADGSPMTEPFVAPIAQAAQMMQAHGVDAAFGSGADLLQAHMPHIKSADVCDTISVIHLAALGAQATAHTAATPLYVRAPDAKPQNGALERAV